MLLPPGVHVGDDDDVDDRTTGGPGNAALAAPQGQDGGATIASPGSGRNGHPMARPPPAMACTSVEVATLPVQLFEYERSILNPVAIDAFSAVVLRLSTEWSRRFRRLVSKEFDLTVHGAGARP
jgi:hypothetical protein